MCVHVCVTPYHFHFRRGHLYLPVHTIYYKQPSLPGYYIIGK